MKRIREGLASAHQAPQDRKTDSESVSDLWATIRDRKIVPKRLRSSGYGGQLVYLLLHLLRDSYTLAGLLDTAIDPHVATDTVASALAASAELRSAGVELGISVEHQGASGFEVGFDYLGRRVTLTYKAEFKPTAAALPAEVQGTPGRS